MPLDPIREHGIEWLACDAVGRILLDRPERANALDRDGAGALARAIFAVLDAGPRVIVLGARGPIFCAGGDIRVFAAGSRDFEHAIVDPLTNLLPAYRQLAEAPCPIVTVVNGPVGGAGLGLALVGDFVLASTTLKLRTGFAAIGLSPDLGASWFLARRVGEVRARQWLMLSEAISAEDCLAAGAVDALHAPERLAAAAEALVAKLLAGAPASLAAMKRLTAGGRHGFAEHLELEREQLRGCAQHADAREGVRAFVEKRAPRFSGT